MKVKREKSFSPVIVTFEDKGEFLDLVEALNAATDGGENRELMSLWMALDDVKEKIIEESK